MWDYKSGTPSVVALWYHFFRLYLSAVFLFFKDMFIWRAEHHRSGETGSSLLLLIFQLPSKTRAGPGAKNWSQPPTGVAGIRMWAITRCIPSHSDREQAQRQSGRAPRPCDRDTDFASSGSPFAPPRWALFSTLCQFFHFISYMFINLKD